jgi:[protein-PII] uridylyltransferase
VAPFSDVDLLFLVRKLGETGSVDGVLYPLWDLGFEVGHAVRTPADCAALAAGDLTVATALLDARLLLGDEDLLRVARERAGFRPGGSRRTRSWIPALIRSVEERRDRFGEVSHLLEPHLKEGRGGLRDFQAARWILSCQGINPADWLTAQPDAVELRGAVDFLSRARSALHAAAGRKTDHLTFEYHADVATTLLPGTPVEVFFECLHRAGHRISALWRRSGTEIRGQTRPLMRRFRGRRVRPGTLTEAMTAWLRDERPALDDLDEALRFVDDAETAAALATVATASLRDRVALAPLLKGLHALGRLGLLLPEVERVAHQVQYDARHAFTTGFHCIETLAILEDLWLGGKEREEPHLTRIAASLAHPAAVRVAALAHDLGKADSREDHASAGMPSALEIARRLGLTEEEAQEAAHLVRAHRILPAVAFGQDLEAPATLTELRDAAGDTATLDGLAALAYADLAATNPGAWAGTWSDWKRDLLLTAHARAFRDEEARPDRLRRARAALVAEGNRLGLEDLDAVWPNIPMREALQLPPDHLAKLLQLARGTSDGPAQWHVQSTGRITEILGVADPVRHLHSRVAGTLASAGMDILSLQAYTWPEGRVHLWLRTVNAGAGAAAPAQLEAKLNQALVTGKPSAGRRSALLDLRKEATPVAVRVRLLEPSHPFHSPLEIQCRDRPGLLADLTRAFEDLGLSVEYALVTTHGPVAHDVFHLKDIFGRRVEGQDKIRSLLARVDAVARGQKPGDVNALNRTAG